MTLEETITIAVTIAIIPIIININDMIYFCYNRLSLSLISSYSIAIRL